MKSVIVAGAGFGGLSAALTLARAGMRVNVFEAKSKPGGRASRFTTAGGYTFDAGPTLIVMTAALRAALGEAAFDDLQLRRLSPGYRVLWPDGGQFDMHSDLALFLDEVARYEGFEHRSSAVRYLADVHEQYVQADAKILQVDHTPLSFARTILSPGKFAPWSLGALLPFARRFFRSHRLVEALTFQPLYLGTSPLRAPAMYALLAAEEAIGGVWYAPGGTGAIVDALVRECERSGVQFHYDTPVMGIGVERGCARVVRTRQGEVRADGVVVNADREPALRALFASPSKRARKLRYGHSAYLWYLSVRGGVDLGHHTVLLPDAPLDAYAQLDAGRLPADPLIYVSNASVTDPSCAPQGDSALMLLAPVPNATALPNFDANELFERVIARVERHAGPIRSRIVEMQSRGPCEFAAELQLAHGAAFGPDHMLDQMGPMRPSIRHPQISNVVFAGSGTRPGSGIPMVLISGRLAAERLSEALA